MYAVNCGSLTGKYYTYYGEDLSLPTRTSCCCPDKANRAIREQRVSHDNDESIYSGKRGDQWCERLRWLAHQRVPGWLPTEYHYAFDVKPFQWNDVIDMHTEIDCANLSSICSHQFFWQPRVQTLSRQMSDLRAVDSLASLRYYQAKYNWPHIDQEW